MPRKPKKPCAAPGCPNLTDGKYCEEHQKQYDTTHDWRSYEEYQRAPGHSLHYGRSWRSIRNAYAKAHPLCERCAKNGRYVKGQEVHHIKPILDGGTNEWDNLIHLCRKCHAELHEELGTRDKNKVVYSYPPR